MAITSGICRSFKVESWLAIHDFANDVFKAALYTDAAVLSQATTAYSATDEVSGTGYTAGGATIEVSSGYPGLNGSVAEVRFDDVTWPNSTITARGVLIYNSSKANRAVLVRDFGGNVSTSNGPFTISTPLEEQAPIRGV